MRVATPLKAQAGVAIGPSASFLASENLAAGDLVEVWNDAGTAKARKASGAASGHPANGFILIAVTSGAQALVFFSGANTACSGLTVGAQYLDGTTPGKSSATPATGTGKIWQPVGTALSATTLLFSPGPAIVLA